MTEQTGAYFFFLIVTAIAAYIFGRKKINKQYERLIRQEKKSFEAKEQRHQKELFDSDQRCRQTIKEAKQKSERVISEAISKSEAAIIEVEVGSEIAIQEKDKAIKEVIQEKDKAIKEVIQEKDKVIKEVIREKDKAIKEVIQEKDKATRKYYREKGKAINEATKLVKQAQLRSDEIVKEAVSKSESVIYDNELRMAKNNKTTRAISDKYFDETMQAIVKSITPNNYAMGHNKMTKTLLYLEKNDFRIDVMKKKQALDKLRSAFENTIRKESVIEEQRRMKTIICEEKMRVKDLELERRDIKKEQDLLKNLLDIALRNENREGNSEQIKMINKRELEKVNKKLEVSYQKMAHNHSMSQLTKVGHVYVISNIGSFGEERFKVGMTRRLDPVLRIDELSDASVPFPFDIHAMISCDDAPGLESKLHDALHQYRTNKVNTRKEFFDVDIKTIMNAVTENHGKVDYFADAEAVQYFETKNMTAKHSGYIDAVREIEAFG